MTIGIMTVIGFVIGVFVAICDDDDSDRMDLIVQISGWVSMGFIFGFIVFMVGNIVINNNIKKDYKAENLDQIKIVLLDEESNSYLRLDYVGEDLKYTYVYEDPLMGRVTKTVPYSRLFVQYIEANEQPYVQIWEMKSNNELVDKLFCYGAIYYTFYIPEGSTITSSLTSIEAKVLPID